MIYILVERVFEVVHNTLITLTINNTTTDVVYWLSL